MNLADRARGIQAVVFDVDGVLTDGTFGYAGGGSEIKFFSARDGHGIKLLRRAGLRVGILSGRSSDANLRRAEELGLDFVYQGEKDKGEAFVRLLREQNLSAEHCLYVGDDVVDMPVMRQAGVSVAVADATADWQTQAPGGHGAAREVARWILQQQGKWETVMERYAG
jgi:3-deoxy-D-manno-octulosonate 8-phosphate phosphatase (KDO 8-P phosphatase)